MIEQSDTLVAEKAIRDVKKLRDAIRRYGLQVCQSSGDWTLHDVSDLAKVEQEQTTQVINENIELTLKVRTLEAAIRTHYEQHADDLCWMDDIALYAAIGLPPRDKSVGDPCAMLENCKRFIAQRCQPGGTWKSYAELEEELATVRRQLDEQIADKHRILREYELAIARNQ